LRHERGSCVPKFPNQVSLTIYITKGLVYLAMYVIWCYFFVCVLSFQGNP